MKVTGIICEYNPFHNGHKYHIEQTKQLCKSDYIIGIMSGPFTQRGTPAITDKYSRTKTALLNGIDIILELPVRYATSSAEGFAHGAVNTLKATNITDSICFGTEEGSLNYFIQIADIIEKEPPLFRETLLNELKKGATYPQARNHAINIYCASSDTAFNTATGSVTTNITDINMPNNILATEYLRACKKAGIDAHTIKRNDAGYHELSLEKHSDSNNTDSSSYYCSASAIRHELNNLMACNETASAELEKYIPYEISDFLSKTLNEDDFSMQLYMALTQNIHCLESFTDISSNLAARIKNNLSSFENWTQYVSLLKTKQITYTRAQRALCHCLLSLNEAKTDDIYPAPYIRVLGFRKSAAKLLKHMTKHSEVPVITKASTIHTLSDSIAKKMLTEDIRAAELYNKTLAYKYKEYNKINEYTHGLVIVD